MSGKARIVLRPLGATFMAVMTACLLAVLYVPGVSYAAEVERAGVSGDAVASSKAKLGPFALASVDAGALASANVGERAGDARGALSSQAASDAELTDKQLAQLEARCNYYMLACANGLITKENHLTWEDIRDLRLPNNPASCAAGSMAAAKLSCSTPTVIQEGWFGALSGVNNDSQYAYLVPVINCFGFPDDDYPGIAEALSWVPAGASDAEKAKAVYDWLKANVSYQYGFSGDHPKLFFGSDPSSRVANCQGYSHAFSILMNRLGVECIMLESYDSVGHGWNMVKIDGDWYHVDLAWNVFLLGDDDVRKLNGEYHHHWGYRYRMSMIEAFGESATALTDAVPIAPKTATVEDFGALAARDPGGRPIPLYDGPAARSACTSFRLSRTSVTMEHSSHAKLDIRAANPAGVLEADAKWTSSNGEAVLVDAAGNLYSGPIGGTSTITCKLGNVTRTCKVTVRPRNIGEVLKVDKPQFYLAEPKTSQTLNDGHVLRGVNLYDWRADEPGSPSKRHLCIFKPTGLLPAYGMEEGVDYTVSYSGAAGGEGTTVLTVTGIGDRLSGSASSSYTIDISEFTEELKKQRAEAAARKAQENAASGSAAGSGTSTGSGAVSSGNAGKGTASSGKASSGKSASTSAKGTASSAVAATGAKAAAGSASNSASSATRAAKSAASSKATGKKANKIAFKSQVKHISAKAVKAAGKKAFKLKASASHGTVRFKALSYRGKAARYITVKPSGKVVVKAKDGKLPRGTYKVRVKAYVKTGKSYKAASRTKLVTVCVR